MAGHKRAKLHEEGILITYNPIKSTRVTPIDNFVLYLYTL